MRKLFVENLQVRGSRVLVRVDFNVPLGKNGEITDDRRIQESLRTIEWLSRNGARTVLMSHWAPSKKKEDPKPSLKLVAERLSQLLRKDVRLAPACTGPEVKRMLQGLGDGDVMLLENLRLGPEEEKNDPRFAAELAELAEIYVNDAFGSAHRAHDSTEGVTHHLRQRAAGFLMKKELDYLGSALESPKRPFVAIIGGAKISSKIDVIGALLKKVDTLIIGGGMAFTFFKAMGREVGKSLLEGDKVDVARKILEGGKTGSQARILLPIDCIAADRYDNDAERLVVDSGKIPVDRQCLDIGPATIELFSRTIREAKTVVWNGPMGVFEFPNFARGTFAVAQALVDCTKLGGITIVGGGDSASAMAEAGLESQVSHVSTGGGASLEFLEGKKLPGVEALSDA